MARILFAGDEVTAAGFRLAGVEILPDDPAVVLDRIGGADGGCDLVLMTAGFSRRLPAETIDRLTSAARPPVVLLPDIRGGEPAPDLERAVLRALGVEGA